MDDHELSKLTSIELESLMDNYIMLVIKQLVQLAAIDDELIAEIDSLDTSGYSLLHYCCMYNLYSLIPVLLGRGANVNKLCATGILTIYI